MIKFLSMVDQMPQSCGIGWGIAVRKPQPKQFTKAKGGWPVAIANDTCKGFGLTGPGTEAPSQEAVLHMFHISKFAQLHPMATTA